MVEDAKKIVYIGEQNGVDASGVVVGDDLESQTEQAYRNVLEVLRSVGATQENVVQQTILVAKGQDIRAGYAAAQRVWGSASYSHNCPDCRRLWHTGVRSLELRQCAR
jgi:2-iminobutanoate/2-iminopropanoate deaminase